MAKKFRELFESIQKKTGKSGYQIAIDLEFTDQRAFLKFLDSKETAGKVKLAKWAAYCRKHLRISRKETEQNMLEDGEN